MRPLLEEPLTYLQRFFQDFRRPAFTLVFLLVSAVSVKILASILTALEGIPLMAPFLKTMGLGYTTWFVSQNLLYAHKRRQTWERLGQWRQEIVGDAQKWLEKRQTSAKVAPFLDQPQTPPVYHTLPGQSPTLPAAVPSDQAALPAEHPADQSALPPATAPAKLFAGVVGTVQVLIPLTGLVDVDALKAKLEKDLSKIEGEIQSLSGRLSNPGFVQKAPADVVEGARAALSEAETQAEILRSRLARL
jgi:valyl-tRNA synthetase